MSSLVAPFPEFTLGNPTGTLCIKGLNRPRRPGKPSLLSSFKATSVQSFEPDSWLESAIVSFVSFSQLGNARVEGNNTLSEHLHRKSVPLSKFFAVDP